MSIVASTPEPTFKHIFGKDWDSLPSVIKRHYANRPYSEDLTIVEGTLDVQCKGILRMLSPLLMLLGQIPAHNENNVPVTVRFTSDTASRSFHFRRTFYFKTIPSYEFHSRMVQINDSEVIEIMKFGFGWKMLYEWDGHKVILSHKGYGLNLFGFILPVPLGILMGKGYAEEIPVDDDTFDMMTSLTHPIFGKIYEYRGRFRIVKDAA